MFGTVSGVCLWCNATPPCFCKNIKTRGLDGEGSANNIILKAKGLMSLIGALLEKSRNLEWREGPRPKNKPPKQKRQPMAAVGWNFP